MEDLLNNLVKAKYRVKNDLFVHCYLDVKEATPAGLTMQVGIRGPGDTVVPAGTRIYLTSQIINRLIGKRQVYELFYVIIQDLEVVNGKPVQTTSPIYKEKRDNQRQTDRKECCFEMVLPDNGDGRHFEVCHGSEQGLTLVYKEGRTLTGIVLGHTYPFEALYRDERVKIPCKVMHIHYDWRTNEHIIGVKVLELDKMSHYILNKLIDPTYAEDTSSSATVDTEEGRIREID